MKSKTPFYEAFDKKKKPTGKGKYILDDSDIEYEDDYYQDKRAPKKSQGAGPKGAVTGTKDGAVSAKGATLGAKKSEGGQWEKRGPQASFSKSPEKFRKAYEHPKYAAYRVDSKCSVSGNCGGCQLQSLSYEGQLIYKQDKVEKLLGKFGKVDKIVGMENPEHYRNKIHATFSYDKKGKIIAGIYEEDTHKVIPLSNCLIQDPRANSIIKTILKLMPSFKMTPYDEDYDTGFLRHVLIRTSHTNDEVMVVVVGGSPIMPSKNNFAKALVKEHPYITSVVFNVNNRKTSMVLGSQETIIMGKGYIEDTLCDISFRISPKSFFQVNAIQAEKMFKKAMSLAALKGQENVLDAYCGIGTIGLIASKHAGEVIGIELNPDAVKDAQHNAKRNSITNAQFYQGDAGEFMVEMANEGETLDAVFMDPPRAGSDENFLKSLVKLSPAKVIYISCNPETLARDLDYLTGNGYKVKQMIPYDMFPMTEHVEAIILMTRSGSSEKK